MMITHKLSVDLVKRETPTRIDAVQNDCGRSLALMLHTNGIPWTIPGDVTVRIRYRNAAGIGGTYNALPDGQAAWRADGHILTVELAPEALSEAGETLLSILLERTGQAISTFDIPVQVHPGIEERFTAGASFRNTPATDDSLHGIGVRIMNGSISSIVLLGDSITDGAGTKGYNGNCSAEPSSNTEGYCWANVFKKFLEERYGVTVKNCGMYGTQMATQMNTALNLVTKQDFVIWLTGTNDRIDSESYRKHFRSYVEAIREKCAGVLVISSIPASEMDEREHPVTMQKMDEIICCESAGIFPYFSMYQEFVRHCEIFDISIGRCFWDHVHPNELGHHIIFQLLCQKLGLPLDPHTNYHHDAVWWDPNAADEILAEFLDRQSDFTAGYAPDVAPGVYMNEYEAETVYTTLSGTHISRVNLLVESAGTITFGTVDLYTLGTQKPVYVKSKTLEVTQTGMVMMNVDLDIGNHETLAIQSTTDTGKLMFCVGSATQDSPLRFWTAGNFQNNEEQCIQLYGTIYGWDL